MRKSIVIIAVFFLSLFPIIVKAESKEYVRTSDSISKQVGKLEINSLHFIDNTNGPSDNYGLVANIINRSGSKARLKAKINYYDKEKVLLYSSIDEYEITAEKDNTFMAFLDEKNTNKYEVENIAFYTVNFEIVEADEEKKRDHSFEEKEVCKKRDYVLSDYEIFVDVHENAIYDIEEDFTVHYNGEKRTIKKIVPLKRNLINRDGSSSVFYRKVINYEEARGLGRSFQVGAGAKFSFTEDSYDEKEVSHKLNYKIKTANRKENVMFDLAISANEWQACIDNISFEVNMPFDFAAENVSFVDGEGRDLRTKVHVSKAGGKLIGTYDGLIDDELHVRIFLGNNSYEEETFSVGSIAIFVIPVGMICISFILWLLFGKDKKVQVKEIASTWKDEDIFEIGLVKRGAIRKRDVVLAILKLAGDGYIRFEKKGKKGHSKRNEYTICKVGIYAGKNKYEKELLHELFSANLDGINEKILKSNYDRGIGSKKLRDLRVEEISTEDVAHRLNVCAEKIVREVNGEYYEKIYEKSSSLVKNFIKLIDYAIVLVIIAIATLEYGTIEDVLINIVLLFFCLFAIKEGLKVGKSKTVKIGALIVIFTSMLISRITPIWETLFFSRIMVYGVVCGTITIFINQIFKDIMPKKTEYGKVLNDRVISLEMYLKSLKKDELKKAVENDGEFIQKIIPYVFAVDFNKNFFKVAEDAEIPLPTWFQGSDYNGLGGIVEDLEVLVTRDNME